MQRRPAPPVWLRKQLAARAAVFLAAVCAAVVLFSRASHPRLAGMQVDLPGCSHGTSGALPVYCPKQPLDAGSFSISRRQLIDNIHGQAASAAVSPGLEQGGNGAQSQQQQQQRKFQFLHIPKAGTSFANTLLLWGCPELAELDPTRVWVTGGNNLDTDLPPSCTARFRQNDIPGRGMVGHTTLDNSTDDDLHSVFALVRSPRARLASAFHYLAVVHAPKTYGHFVNATQDTLCSTMRNSSSILYSEGVQVRLVAGQSFRRPLTPPLFEFESAQPPGEAMVQEACRRLHLFAFVGITDLYDASICLFHAMHGGQARQADYQNVRPTPYLPNAIRSLDCNDTADETLFSCALQLFMYRLQQHPQCLHHLPSI